MKVLQLIDSLDAGGAERVAVNYANSLATLIEVSYLCTTRKEGLLKESLSNHVEYLFLNRKSTFDFKAIKKLHAFVKINKIDIIHAHGSSFFIATIIKIVNPKITLIWHEHYGNREQTSKINKFILKICSYFFSYVITVNNALKTRSENKLLARKVYVLPNYPVISSSLKRTMLYGVINKRIVCLANLRSDKDHINLLKAFKIVNNNHPDWTLHLVGQDFKDAYSKSIRAFIDEHVLDKHVFMYGSCPNTLHILHQATIGVLSSKSEGLPLALLEYGMAGLAVVVTDVGDCKEVVSDSKEGVLVPPGQEGLLAKALVDLIENEALRTLMGHHLKTKISTSFSEQAILDTLVGIYKTVGS